MTGARQHVVTPGMQEAALEQLARMILGSQQLAGGLRFDALAEALNLSLTQATNELNAHRARHVRTLPERAPAV